MSDTFFNSTGTVNGTTITASTKFIAAVGTETNPAYAFSTDVANEGSGMWKPTTGQLSFSTAGVQRLLFGSTGNIAMFGVDTNTVFYPNTNGGPTLGRTANRWAEVWCTAGAFNSSNRDLKKEIEPTKLGLEFINALMPRQYRWKNGKRLHHGFVAQELGAWKDENGETFAGFIDSKIRNPEEPQDYALSMIEFIAPMVKAIQQLSEKVESLEKLLNSMIVP